MKVLIPTSGLGSRLGEYTKYTNKSLLKIGDKPAISYIIESYPKDSEFIITLGHYGDFVKQFLTMCYPKYNITFVEVNPYQGAGSNLLKSISFAKDYLQCPFIFHTCDTILQDYIPHLKYNWMMCCKSDNSTAFRTISVNGNIITKINEKGELYYDYAYLGVAGIVDYIQFWSILDSLLNNSNNLELSDCHIFSKMLSTCTIKNEATTNWFDTGNIENLVKAKTYFKSQYTVLDKHEESIYFFEDYIIKFFYNSKICKDRIERALLLKTLVPEITDTSKNFYKYKKAEGEVLSHIVTELKIEQLIEWAIMHLWYTVDIPKNEFISICDKFYYEKSLARIKKYLNSSNEIDEPHIINGVCIPSCAEIFRNIDWNNLCEARPTQFHGDFILENILQTSDGNFKLIDWRQDFGDCIIGGDFYYDLAKLNHNLMFNHDIVAKNNFIIEKNGKEITCDILRSHNLALCQEMLFKKLNELHIDSKKVKILTYIIWLNMAPLHIYPLNKFLFYFGKYNLWRELCQK